ncbi:unnamed protein product [Rotaria sp. Silwood1]|nr:unnamed protein product [Rotaria sp. Silwood1]
MSIAVTEFYKIHLLQQNIYSRLISLCVSHTLTIDDGLWLALDLSAFINLRHLSLIDIKRSCFELMLNTSSPNTSLVMFSIRYSEFYQAAYTYKGVPEGAYYDRIFCLFPLLRVCHLRFWRYVYDSQVSQIVLPLNKTFIPIETNLLNLQSLVLRECSPAFLLHLLGHHPQLQELSFDLCTPWLPDKHPLINDYNNRVSRIDKRLVPNLRRLKITLNYNSYATELLDQLFYHDVLYSLTNFTLVGMVNGPYIVCKLLSMLCHQCSYSAFTLPRIDKSLDAYSYFDKSTICVQSRWSYTVPTLNNRLTYVNNITLNGRRSQIDNEFLCYLRTIISWHQIISLTIDDSFDLCQLSLILSKMIHLRSLELHYHFNYNVDDDWNNQNLMKLFNDTSLCNILTSNGLQKLHLYTNWEYPDTIIIASLIVKRLPHLEIIELNCHNSSQVPETLHILMNGLPKLNFIIFHAFLTGEKQQELKMQDLQKHCTRTYRIEDLEPLADMTIIHIWL